MSLKKIAKLILPDFIKNKIYEMMETANLNKYNSLKQEDCVTTNLFSNSGFSLNEVLTSKEIAEYWEISKAEIDAFEIPDGFGGVNPGDRKALYYLICNFKPASVLEVGTHVGASTLHITSALNRSQIEKGNKVDFTTIDIKDVNSTKEQPWLNYGTKFSPLEMMKKFNYDNFVTFKTGKSLNFLKTTTQKFDFIFLDGDHSQTTVYQEIPAALKLLNPNGVILLHDYFPENKPLWSNGKVIEGPYIATQRLISEGADIIVLPLGNLPWFTKLDSNYTSLALLMRKS